ncbi:hypothetical protein PINS_up024325 [Pythium insidiosum]|nr:hypothetical protein PINS_up024325 [Pythium insidiosum]
MVMARAGGCSARSEGSLSTAFGARLRPTRRAHERCAEWLIYVQNLPSTVVAHALDPQEGDVIIDMCAAPGGKTSHVATLMKNKGLLVCCDKSKRKAVELKRLFSEQLPFDIVHPLRLDSMHSVLPRPAEGERVLSVREVLEKARAETPADAALLKVAGFYPETFDRVLLDPPCSALGLRPRLVHDGDEDDLAIFPSMQRNFLWCASFLLSLGARSSIRRARSAPTRTSAWCGTRWTTSRWHARPRSQFMSETRVCLNRRAQPGGGCDGAALRPVQRNA